MRHLLRKHNIIANWHLFWMHNTNKDYKKDIAAKSLDFQGFFGFLPLDHIITRKKILTLMGFEPRQNIHLYKLRVQG